MKTSLLLIIALVALLALPAGLSLADNGPHGGFMASTDACAGCHRAHTAAGPTLLVNTVAGLCGSCHGSTGNGADTNVVDGIYLDRDLVSESPAEGVANQGLLGGGFTNATMDTDVITATVATAATVTSSHLIDGSTGTAWGNGAIVPGVSNPGPSIPLSCTSCHDPHGRAGTGGAATYRLLRAVPQGSGALADVNVPDMATKNYTVPGGTNMYWMWNSSVFYTTYGGIGTSSTMAVSIANWCGQCHTRYLAVSGSWGVDSGDPIFRYRHTTLSGSRTCLRCHTAHGTTATMGVNSGGESWPGGATTPSGNGRSSLLRADNRGVCEQCHHK